MPINPNVIRSFTVVFITLAKLGIRVFNSLSEKHRNRKLARLIHEKKYKEAADYLVECGVSPSKREAKRTISLLRKENANTRSRKQTEQEPHQNSPADLN